MILKKINLFCSKKQFNCCFSNYNFNSLKSIITTTSTNDIETETKKLFISENSYARSALLCKPDYKKTFYDFKLMESFENWNNYNPSILNFKDYLSTYSPNLIEQSQSENNETRIFFKSKLDISSPTAKDLLSSISHLSDEELHAVLYLAHEKKMYPNQDLPNITGFYKGIDNEFMRRFSTWNFIQLLVSADLFYNLLLVRNSFFCWNVIKKGFRKCDKLSQVEFIRFLFCLNFTRKLPDSINLYELEHSLGKHVNALSVEEAGVAAMAFFKTKTSIRDTEILANLLNCGMKDPQKTHSVFLASLAKVGRLSAKIINSNVLQNFQTVFVPEINRLTITAAIHLAIIGSRSYAINEELVKSVQKKAENNLAECRLKELERLLLTLTMFNFNCDSFCHKVIEELRSNEREREIEAHGKSFTSILFYISLRQIYPYDLISKIYSTKFLMDHYGKNVTKYHRELLCLDYTLELECPDYKGNRLPEKLRRRATKPDTKEKVSSYQLTLRTLASFFKDVLGGENFVHICNILPQFHTAELVFCLDELKRPVKIPEAFRQIPDYDFKNIPDEFRNKGYDFHTAIPCGSNFFCQLKNKEKQLLAQVQLQARQLKKMGFKVHLVPFEQFKSDAELRTHLQNLKNEIFDIIDPVIRYQISR